MRIRIITGLCVLISVFFAYGTLRIQNIALSPGNPNIPPTKIQLRMSDGKTTELPIQQIKSASFWYSLLVFSKIFETPESSESFIAVENNPKLSSFSFYYANEGRFGVLQAYYLDGGMAWCPILKIPRKENTYTSFPIEANCLKGKTRAIAVAFLKPTSWNEKIVFVKNDFGRFGEYCAQFLSWLPFRA